MAIGLSTVVLTGNTAQADQRIGYFGANLASIEYSEEGISQEADLKAAYARVGLDLTTYFSSELRLGFGLGNDTVDVLGREVDVQLDKVAGAYFRAGIPASEKVYPYAIVGYTYGELTASVTGLTRKTESESDLSYGVGIDFIIDYESIITFEYMSYLDKDGAEIKGPSIGLLTTF